MQDLIKQEQFEIEVLDRLNSKKLLSHLVFAGGTMLRLCFGLNRYSVDLDFWITTDIDRKGLFIKLNEYLSKIYTIKDSAYKYYTMVLEIRSKDYPSSLKIEIRKEKKRVKTEQVIAYSRHSNIQVLLRAVSLTNMMKLKIDAFLNRKEIRDLFDIEFLFKRGGDLRSHSIGKLKALLKEIDSLPLMDYKVKLGSILEYDMRKYYLTNNFNFLKSAITEILSDQPPLLNK
ncbi:MAG: nucleotidyl transferase AbiEii/AbiGii toxin family protein [Nitrospirota bacterium]